MKLPLVLLCSKSYVKFHCLITSVVIPCNFQMEKNDQVKDVSKNLWSLHKILLSLLLTNHSKK